MAIPRSLLACCAVEIWQGPPSAAVLRTLKNTLSLLAQSTEWSLPCDGKHLYCRNFRGRDFSQELICKQMGVANSAGPMGVGGMTKHFPKGNFLPPHEVMSPQVTWWEVMLLLFAKNRIGYTHSTTWLVIKYVSSLSTGWRWLTFCWWFIVETPS